MIALSQQRIGGEKASCVTFGVSSLLSQILLFIFYSPSGGSRVEAGPAEIL
jgi:hypothetical protein